MVTGIWHSIAGPCPIEREGHDNLNATREPNRIFRPVVPNTPSRAVCSTDERADDTPDTALREPAGLQLEAVGDARSDHPRRRTPGRRDRELD